MSSSQNLGTASPNRYSDIWVRPGCCGKKSDHYHWYKNGLSESPSCSFPSSFFSPHDSQDIQRRGMPTSDVCPVCRSHWENMLDHNEDDATKERQGLRDLAAAGLEYRSKRHAAEPAAAHLGYAADDLDAFQDEEPKRFEETAQREQAAREACGAWLVSVAVCGSFLGYK